MQLSKRIGKQQPALARANNEGQLAWLKRLVDSGEIEDSDTIAALNLTAQRYRQLRYGRLSEKDIKDADYQTALKQLRADVQTVYK